MCIQFEGGQRTAATAIIQVLHSCYRRSSAKGTFSGLMPEAITTSGFPFSKVLMLMSAPLPPEGAVETRSSLALNLCYDYQFLATNQICR